MSLQRIGIDVTTGFTALGLNNQAPLPQKLNGLQPLKDFRSIAGALYSFGF